MPRFVDCWILVQWVLASVHITWATWHSQAKQRDTFSEFGRPHYSSRDAAQRHHQATQFLRSLSRSHCANLQSWSANFSLGCFIPEIQVELVDLIKNAIDDASLRAFVEVKQVLELTYAWARFFVQQRITVYDDPVEQLGAQLALDTVPYEGGETLHALFGALHVVDPTHVCQSTHMRQRWSYFGRQGSARYLSGPISLINHACHEHSNVVLKLMRYGKSRRRQLTRMVAVAERQIMPGDKIYATYDNDSKSLSESRGIKCNICN